MKKLNRILNPFLLAIIAFVFIAFISDLPTGNEIMEKVNARNEGEVESK